jgi:hypothetical protein
VCIFAILVGTRVFKDCHGVPDGDKTSKFFQILLAAAIDVSGRRRLATMAQPHQFKV